MTTIRPRNSSAGRIKNRMNWAYKLRMAGLFHDFPDGLPENIRTLKQDARRYSARLPVMDSLDLPRLIFPAQKLGNLRRPAKLVDDVL